MTNLPLEGHIPKLSDRTRRAFIREVAQRPNVIHKDLQSSNRETEVSILTTTISQTLNRVGL